MTHGNDDAAAPCADERAAMANALPKPDAVSSIRAYNADPSNRGFVVVYPSPPLKKSRRIQHEGSLKQCATN